MKPNGAYYNEFDPFAAAWLRELIKAGHIASGVVDERSIEDVVPDDLAEFIQCHFFAGIGVWSYALRRAGWPDDRPVWTGSCPCQSFSTAGKRRGFADERHLWPAFFHLISQLRPLHIFGEQVASKDGLAWLDLVQTDLENAAYTVGAVDTCAAGFGAPHIRQRLYWVAHSTVHGRVGGDLGNEMYPERQAPGGGENEGGRGDDFAYGVSDMRLAEPVRPGRPARGTEPGHGPDAGGGSIDRMDNAEHDRREAREPARQGSSPIMPPSQVIRMGDTHSRGSQKLTAQGTGEGRTAGRPSKFGELEHRQRPGQTNGHWRAVDWLFCRDGGWRPVAPGSFPLAYGVARRVGRLRGYGNALNAVQAEELIRAYMAIQEMQ